jgi:hypothetical protein
MTAYWSALAGKGWTPPVPSSTEAAGITDPEQRMIVRAEIEAIAARAVFGLDREELEHVLETFPTAQEYEEAEFGEFRSRRLIREAYGRSGRWIDEAVRAVKGNVEDREALLAALGKVEIADAPRGPVKLDAAGNPVQNVYR